MEAGLVGEVDTAPLCLLFEHVDNLAYSLLRVEDADLLLKLLV